MPHLLLSWKESRNPQTGGIAMPAPTTLRQQTIPQLALEGLVFEHQAKEYHWPLRAPIHTPRIRSIQPQEGTLQNTSLLTTLTFLERTGHHRNRCLQPNKTPLHPTKNPPRLRSPQRAHSGRIFRLESELLRVVQPA
jgi:hypothetical protein